jgi:dethiobiotin synthetase
MPRVVIAGVGTGVGKTVVTSALRRELSRRGAVAALKPIESGYSDLVSDARAIGGEHWVPPLYALQAPVAPHLAARAASVQIDFEQIAAWLDQHSAGHDWTLVETAGGLFTPLTAAGATNSTLLRRLQPCSWLLVAANRLGVLHEVAATLIAARSEHPAPRAVVLSNFLSDASTDTNAEELRALHPGLTVVEVGIGGTLPPEQMDALWRALS